MKQFDKAACLNDGNIIAKSISGYLVRRYTIEERCVIIMRDDCARRGYARVFAPVQPFNLFCGVLDTRAAHVLLSTSMSLVQKA
jgi:hypothetical protein